MEAYFSPMIGALHFPAVQDDAVVLDVLSGEAWPDAKCVHLFPFANDWEVISGERIDDVTALAQERYWLFRAELLVRSLIAGVGELLAISVLDNVETILQSHVKCQHLINRLLIAPLKDPAGLKQYIDMSLSKGFAATAKLLDDLRGLQPLLRRFSDVWLRLPTKYFGETGTKKEEIWVWLSRDGLIRPLIESSNRSVLTSKWNTLALRRNDFNTPQRRQALAQLGKVLAEELALGEGTHRISSLGAIGNEGELLNEKSAVAQRANVQPRADLARTASQIDAIVKAVSQGSDANARRYLAELIEMQLSVVGGEERALKTLCNIAQRCTKDYRLDFASYCFDRARAINPGDPWMLTQEGNHYKKLGDFERALGVLHEALPGAVDTEMRRIILASIADVDAKQGKYEAAIARYQEISGWSILPEISIAIADVYRWSGDVDSARKQYNSIIIRFSGHPELHRAKVGKAELAKRKGRVHDAISIYNSVLQGDLDDSSRTIYRLALCHLFKLTAQHIRALKVVDGLLEEKPFLFQARLQKASVLALLGQAENALDLIKNTHRSPIDEWVFQYFYGLVLLHLDRFDDAKTQLLGELKGKSISLDDQPIPRVAAALAYLAKHDYEAARVEIEGIHPQRDFFTEYVQSVLRLHLAVVEKDSLGVTKTVTQLEKFTCRRPKSKTPVRNKYLEEAIVCLKGGDVNAALHQELLFSLTAA